MRLLQLVAIFCSIVPAVFSVANDTVLACDPCQETSNRFSGAVWPKNPQRFRPLSLDDVNARVERLHGLMESAGELFKAGRYDLEAKVRKEIVMLSISVAGEDDWRTATAHEQERTAGQLADMPLTERNAFQMAWRGIEEANALMAAGKYADAQAKFVTQSAQLDGLLGTNYLSIESRLSAGRCLLLLGRYRDVLKVDTEAYDDAIELYGEFHPDAARALADLASAHLGVDRQEDADKAFYRAFGILVAIAGEDKAAQARARVNAARYFNDRGKPGASEAAAEDAIEQLSDARDAESKVVLASAQYQLAVSCMSQGRNLRARELLEQLLSDSTQPEIIPPADKMVLDETLTASRALLKKLGEVSAK